MARDLVQRFSWRKAMRSPEAPGRRPTYSCSFVGPRCSVVTRGRIFFFLMLFSFHTSAFRPGLVRRQCRSIKAPFGLVASSTAPFSATSATVDLHALAAPLQLTATYECLFDIQVPEGRCVGLRLPDLPDDHPDALVGDRILESSRTSTSTTNSNSHYSTHEEQHHQRHWIYSHLHSDEIRYGLQLSRQTQASFWIGRLALRKALSSSSSPCTAVSTRSILKDSHGRPLLPPGFLGSISHKGRTGVALVTPAPSSSGECSVSSLSSTAFYPPCFGIGVDIEATKPKRRSIARKVLTPNEQRSLGQLPVRIAASHAKDYLCGWVGG